jgi:hypothetical protein
MEKGGDLEDCISTPEAEELSLKFSDEQKAKLPKPGEVDLIVGGPPCQVLATFFSPFFYASFMFAFLVIIGCSLVSIGCIRVSLG